MQTAKEIEAQLTEATVRMREVSKAAKDQAAKTGQEPTEVPGPDLGQPVVAPLPVGKPQG